jgi:hypothetical protein
MKIIKNKQELKELVDSLEQQKFTPYYEHYEKRVRIDADYMHTAKVKDMIIKGNIHGIEKYGEYELNKILEKETDYAVIQKKIKEFFSKFNPENKIKELVGSFTFLSVDIGNPPSNWSPSKKDIIEWYQFKKKWNLKDDKIQREKVIIYNFDDKKIRINSYGHVDSFLKLYEYVYGKKPLDIRWNSYGIPQNIGDIEIKIFQNDNIEIRGDIDKLKKLFYNKIEDSGEQMVIFYNGKREERNFNKK